MTLHPMFFVTLFACLLVIPNSGYSAPLRYGETRAPGIIHPVYATTMSEARINELIFEGLFAET